MIEIVRIRSESELRRRFRISDVHVIFQTSSTLVYTDPTSPWVIKRMTDGSTRWMPEVVAHGLAEDLRPDLVLHCAGAFYTAFKYFIVYEKAEDITKDAFDERIDEALDCIEAFNRLGVYHIDTKRANFLVRNNKLVLHDWGLALIVGHRVPADLRYDPPPPSEQEAVLEIAQPGETFEQAAVRIAIDCQLRLVLAGNHMLQTDAVEYFCGTRIHARHVGNHADAYMYTVPRWFNKVYPCVYLIGSERIRAYFDGVIDK
jgi:hypothetical protein